MTGDQIKACPHGLPMYRNIPAGNELGCADPLACLRRLEDRLALATASVAAAESRGRQAGRGEALEQAANAIPVASRPDLLAVKDAILNLGAPSGSPSVPAAQPPDYDPIVAPIPEGDWMGPHAALPKEGMRAPNREAPEPGGTLAGRIAELESAIEKEIENRDAVEEWADKLAYAIGYHFGVDVGEHSNLNNPWRTALDRISDQPRAAPSDNSAPATPGLGPPSAGLTDAELNMTPDEWAEAFAEDPSCTRAYMEAAIRRGRADGLAMAEREARAEKELIRQTLHHDGLGMGWTAGEAVAEAIALRIYSRSRALGNATAEPAPSFPESPAVAADAEQGERCKHGIRKPWECKDCLYEPQGERKQQLLGGPAAQAPQPCTGSGWIAVDRQGCYYASTTAVDGECGICRQRVRIDFYGRCVTHPPAAGPPAVPALPSDAAPPAVPCQHSAAAYCAACWAPVLASAEARRDERWMTIVRRTNLLCGDCETDIYGEDYVLVTAEVAGCQKCVPLRALLGAAEPTAASKAAPPPILGACARYSHGAPGLPHPKQTMCHEWKAIGGEAPGYEPGAGLAIDRATGEETPE